MKLKVIGLILLIVAIIIGGGWILLGPSEDPSNAPVNETMNNTTEPGQTDNTTESPPEDSPGVSSGEIVEPELLTSHETNIRRQNSTVRITETEDSQTTTTTIRASPSILVFTEESSSEKREVVSTRRSTLTRETQGNKQSYEATTTGISTERYTKQGFFQSVLKHTDTVRITQTPNKDTVTQFERRLNQSQESNAATALGYDSISGIDAQFKLTEGGLIKQATVEIVGISNRDSSVTVSTTEYEVRRLDNRPIQEPRWTSTARESNTLVEMDINSSNGWIVFEHNGLSTLPSGTSLSITAADGEVSTVSIPSSIEQGDVVYLLRTSQGWTEFINERPGRASVGSSSAYVVEASDGNVQYFIKTVA